MIIKRVASVVLFSVARGGRWATNNAVSASLFLFSQTQFSTHIIELFEAFFALYPEMKFIQDFSAAMGAGLLAIFLPIIRIILYFIFLFAKKSFIEQGSLTLGHRPKAVLKSGVVAYLVLVSIGAVFFVSAVGIFFTFIIVAVSLFSALIGEASIAILVGKLVSHKIIKKRSCIEMDLILGALVLELLKFIPVISGILNIFVIPAVALGVVITAAVDGGIRKIIYYSDYDEIVVENSFDRKVFRDIILGEAEGAEKHAKEKD